MTVKTGRHGHSGPPRGACRRRHAGLALLAASDNPGWDRNELVT